MRMRWAEQPVRLTVTGVGMLPRMADLRELKLADYRASTKARLALTQLRDANLQLNVTSD